MDENLTTKTNDTVSDITPGMRVWLRLDDGFFGAGIARILAEVDQTNNLTTAAMNAGMSYSKAYKLIGKLEKDTECKLLDRHLGGPGGGGCVLTDNGKDLLARYNQLMDETDIAMRAAYQRIFADVQLRKTPQKK